MVVRNPQQRAAALVSLALHVVALSTILLLTPRVAVTLNQPTRYRVTTITFPPTRPSVPPVSRVRPRVAAEAPPLPVEPSVNAVHTAGFDQTRTAQRVQSGDDVVAGKWDAARSALPPLIYAVTPGPAGLYAVGSGTTLQAVPTAATTVDAPARLLATPMPRYTDEAKKLRVTGDVLLEVLLAANGAVHVMRVVAGLGHGLDDTAVAAVNRARCRPALRGGQPIDVTAMIRVTFQLA
jgi:TonB family protein